MSKPLKDKNGNLIMRGCNWNKYGHVAVEYLIPCKKIAPFCQYHYITFRNNLSNYSYTIDNIMKNGIIKTNNYLFRS